MKDRVFIELGYGDDFINIDPEEIAMMVQEFESPASKNFKTIITLKSGVQATTDDTIVIIMERMKNAAEKLGKRGRSL
jgi:hypothetical protein